MLNYAQKEIALLLAGMSVDERAEVNTLVGILQTDKKRMELHYDLFYRTLHGEIFGERLNLYLKTLDVEPNFEVVDINQNLEEGSADYDGRVEGTDYRYEVKLRRNIENTSVAYYQFTAVVSYTDTDISELSGMAETLVSRVKAHMGDSIVIPYIEELRKGVQYDELDAQLIVKQLHDLGESVLNSAAKYIKKIMEDKGTDIGPYQNIMRFIDALLEYGK